MPKQQKCPECEEGAPAWMLTFGDMTTLILTFFVLLITMMTIDPKKFVEVLGIFKQTSGEGYHKPTTEEPIPTEQFFIQIIRASTRRTTVPDGGMNPTVSGETPVVFSHKENYVAKIADTRFFEEFSIALNKDAKVQLESIARIARAGANRIRLIGHYSRSEAPSKFARQAQERANETGDDVIRGLFARLEYSDDKGKDGPVLKEGDDGKPVWINDSDDLALYRARAVLEFLASRGVARQRMTVDLGGMISDIKVASARQTLLTKGFGGPESAWRDVGETDIHAGTAESMELSPPTIETPTVEVRGKTAAGHSMLRQWPHFIFTEGGDDRGRTVEIVITGEVVGMENELFAPATGR